ncbi:MAG: ABC transporter ATP-binding protein [Spirochaetaceae bacterium]|nr:ABC transporter ATP-binding protein [Spirochaetaceae bacterium]
MLCGLSLRVPRGRIVALLGANGAGKTTAIRAVAGLLPFEQGEVTAGVILLEGRRIDRMRAHHRARLRVVAVLEGRRVFADLTVDDNLRAASWALSGRRAHPRGGLEAVYRFFPLLEARRRHRAGYLSGGEQQMLAIGRALLTEPAVMLLDEPSLGLAPRLREEIFAGIARINRERGVSMLLVEQNAVMALEVARYGYVMEQGRMALEGPAEMLREMPEVREAYLASGKRRV